MPPLENDTAEEEDDCAPKPLEENSVPLVPCFSDDWGDFISKLFEENMPPLENDPAEEEDDCAPKPLEENSVPLVPCCFSDDWRDFVSMLFEENMPLLENDPDEEEEEEDCTPKTLEEKSDPLVKAPDEPCKPNDDLLTGNSVEAPKSDVFDLTGATS
ncbi:hypothetical protein Hanom_Chr01g00073471 [Helianthus anomalus]